MAETKNYIDNKAFYAEIVIWRAEYDENPGIRISNSIAEKLLLICNRITYRPNFRNYSYREEMAEDALENSIRYFKTFDPTKSKNPFAYFSSVAYMACVNRINKEKQQMAIRAKWIQGMAMDTVQIADNQGDTDLTQMQEYLGSYYEFDLDAYDAAIRAKRKPKPKKLVE